MRSHLIPTLVSIVLFTACGAATPPAAESAPPSAPSPVAPASAKPVIETTLQSVGLDELALDRKADPCSDFYQFACGGWLATTEIPSDKPYWARSFSEIDKRNELELKRILEDAAAKTAKADEVTQKIGAFYGACMDEAAIESAGAKPIKALLAKAAAVKDVKSLASAVTELHASGIWPLFNIAPSQDPDDATRWQANLDQDGLGMPDRDYYLREDDEAKKLRAVYLEHVARMLALTGVPEARAKKAATDVMWLETELAKISKTQVQRRDVKDMFHRRDRVSLAKLTPAFDWDGYFEKLSVPDIKDVNVMAPKFFEGVQALLTTVKPEVWRSYLQSQVVIGSARILSKAFVDERFKLEQAFTGQPELPARWKRCVEATDGALGELVAQPYLATNFPGNSKEAAEQMVVAISQAFGSELDNLSWMDAQTNLRAHQKLAAMGYLIGYPDKWKRYDFAIDRRQHARNSLASQAFELKRNLAKIGQTVDRDEWQMSPPTVNAYYDAQRNHMVFPAGILQPPFYSVKNGIAVNLGAIGMVMGHELTHGFDDQGSQFDDKGNLKNWWEPAVSQRFEAKTACVVNQYGAYEVLPGLKLNGKLTLGENIADMGGIKLAFAAYRQMRKDARESVSAGGFTEDQQFFLGFAQAWCGKFRPEIARMVVQTNPHSLNRERVRGPLSNMPQFADAFACPEESPMRPQQTCTVW